MTGWQALRTAIDGTVRTPDEPGYAEACRPALARFAQVRPQAVVLAATAADVAATIGFARRNGLRTSTRSGGHCFAGRSSAGDIVIDVTPMRAVSLTGDVATVGAGARLGEVYAALAEHGRTIPAGTAASVGIAGLTLGGGLGLLGRTYGLACDRLVGAQVVLADGHVVECAGDDELFWALRGAGRGFGVVTSLRFATVPLPTTTWFRSTWSPRHAAAAVEAWQAWAPFAPDGLDATLRVTTTRVTLLGAMHDGEPPLARFTAGIGADPATDERGHLPYLDVLRHLSQPGPGIEFSRSEYFRQPLPADAIDAVLADLDGELSFTAWGGAYNRTPADATAFVHRDELFMVEHVASTRPWVDRSWAALHPWGSGRVYPNFPDPDLADEADAYYGTNYDRLLQAKQSYDPDNWFDLPLRKDAR